jgi:hypothetical protein
VYALQAAYRTEAVYLLHATASCRWDKDYSDVDPSDLQPPDALDSDWKRDEVSDR